MRVLWIATKAPWPPADGGRLLLRESLAALKAGARGAPPVELTLVAPVAGRDRRATEEALIPLCRPLLVAARPRPRALALLAAALSRRSYSVVRHERPELTRVVARELAAGEPGTRPGYDLVVAEQLQAFAQSAPAARAGIPRLLRAQNVESDLWRQLGEESRGASRKLLLREASRLERAEREAVESAAATLALSPADAARLHRLAALPSVVEALAPPFPRLLPGAASPLPGAPAVVLFGSAGWEPNRRGERQFVDRVWPAILAACPGARLHRFGAEAADPAGNGRRGIVAHRAPASSEEAFAPGSILVLPLAIASGVRMRLLEAWARGVVVVASPQAASGLDAEDGRELLLARDPDDFARALGRLATEPDLGERLIAGGRARLAADHLPERFAEGFASLAGRLARRAGGPPIRPGNR